MPERPDKGWEQFDGRHRDESTHRLGNLTLLETALNRELGNAAYSGKREVYRRSEFAVTRRVAEQFEAWTVEKIRAHQQWMARQATAIWRISF